MCIGSITTSLTNPQYIHAELLARSSAFSLPHTPSIHQYTHITHAQLKYHFFYEANPVLSPETTKLNKT